MGRVMDVVVAASLTVTMLLEQVRLGLMLWMERRGWWRLLLLQVVALIGQMLLLLKGHLWLLELKLLMDLLVVLDAGRRSRTGS